MKNIYTLPALLIILTLAVCGNANAANYFWVGGSGIWSDYANHWATSSGGAVFYAQEPSSADNVYFDGNSFSAPNQTVILDNGITATCNNMDWTGAANSPTLTGAAAALNISGSLTFITDMSLTFTGSVTFQATSTGKTITSAGQTNFGDGALSFDGTGGDWTLQDDLTIGQPLYILNGTLNTNGKTLSINSFSVAQGGTTHGLTLGSSVVNVSGNWGGNDAGFVLNAGTSVINMTNDNGASFNANAGIVTTYNDVNFSGAGGATFTGGNNTFHNVTFSSGATINGNNTYNNLTFNGAGATVYTLQGGRTQKINGTLSVNGTCTSSIALLSSNTTAATINIPTGTPVITYASLTYISATGANTPFAASNSIDGGNNVGFIITSAAANLYWVGGSGNWSDGNHWSLTSGGSPFGCIPSQVANVHFDVNSFPAGSDLTIDVTANCKDMDWTGAGNTPTIDLQGNTLNIYGSLTLAANMTITSSYGNIQFVATTAGHSISTKGVDFGCGVWFGTPAGAGMGGVYDLQDNFKINPSNNSNSFYFCNGTLNTNNHSLTSFTCHLDYGGTDFTLNPGTSVINLSQWNGNGSQITMDASAATFNVSGDSFFGGTTFNCNSEDPSLVTYGDINFTAAVGNVEFTTCGTTYGNISNVGSSFHLAGRYNNIFGNFDMHVPGCVIDEGNTYNNLTLSNYGGSYLIAATDTQIIKGSIIGGNGSGCSSPLILQSNIVSFFSTDSTAFIKSSSPVSLSFVSVSYINAIGNIPFIDNNGTNAGGKNLGWTINSAAATDLYWIDGTGNWSDGSHWSATSGGTAWTGCAPSATTNVHFDANSFSGVSQTVTIDPAVGYCNNMDWTGANHPILTGSYTALAIYGSLTLASGMTMSGSCALEFVATTPGHTITTNGVNIAGGVWFGTPGQGSTPANGGMGGVWDLQDDLTINPSNNSNSIFWNNGTLNTNNHTITSYTIHLDYGTQNTAITVNPGTSVFNINVYNGNGAQLTMDASKAVFNVAGDNGFFGGTTFNCNSEDPSLVTYGDINFTEPSGQVEFTTCGTTHGNISNVNSTFDLRGRAKNIFGNFDMHVGGNTIEQGNTYNDLVLTGTGGTYTFAAASVQTIKGKLDAIGSAGAFIQITSDNPGHAVVFSKASGTVCADYLYLQDNVATGGATFNAGPNSQDAGNISGWVFGGGSSGTPGISIVSSSSTICTPGQSLTFTATPVNASGDLTYQWEVNGTPAGTDSSVFTSSVFNNGDKVTCVLISGPACVANADTTISSPVNVGVGVGGNAGTVTATRDSVCTGSPVNLSTTGSSGNLQWQSSASNSYTNIQGATSTTYTGNTSETATYRVVAGSGVCLDSSNTILITANPSPVAVFTDDVTGSQVVFNSGGTSGATIYNWDFGDDSTSTQPNPTHTYKSKGTYHACLNVYNGNNCSFTICRDVVISTITGLQNSKLANAWQVYPDPFSDALFINAGNTTIQSVEVYDLLGRTLYNNVTEAVQNGPLQINLTGLTPGVYYLKVKSNETIHVQQIIKQ